MIRRQIARVQRAFAALPFRPFYAMKANGTLAILRLIRERRLRLRCGLAGRDLIWPAAPASRRTRSGSPARTSPTTTCAPSPIRASSSTSTRCRRSTAASRSTCRIRSRCASTRTSAPGIITTSSPPASGVKFGIDLAEIDTARMVVEDSGRKVVGLHAHIGSGIDTIAPLLESARRLLELAPSFPNLRWINFGGGISIPYRPGEPEFPIDEYGAELTRIAGRCCARAISRRSSSRDAISSRDRARCSARVTAQAHQRGRRLDRLRHRLQSPRAAVEVRRVSPHRQRLARLRRHRCARRSTTRRCATTWSSPATSASRATSSRATPTARRDPRASSRRRSATSSPSATPAPTASRWPRTTTRGCCRRRCSSTAAKCA